MKTFLLNILLSALWVAITGGFSAKNFLVGYILAFMILWFVQGTGEATPYFDKVRAILFFFFFFIWELIKANFRLALDILTPAHRMEPGVIAIPLDVETDAEIVLLSTLITLTPGTLSLHVSRDRKMLFIHAMYIDDPDRFRESVKSGFEHRILELFR